MPRRKRAVIWSPEAEQDLFDIWEYLTAEASARTAENIFATFIERASEFGLDLCRDARAMK
jgi:plasmid stabilization system protein ParE